jgi:hypothetical protein
MASNPFYISPVDTFSPLQALMMGYDRSQKMVKERDLSAARQDAGTALAEGGDTRGALARLIAAGDPTSAATIAQLGKADTTDDIKEYNLAKQQGFKGSFFDFQTQLKRAGANQNTINMPPMEKAYDAAVGKEFAEQNIGIIKGSQEAQRKLGTLDRLGQILSDPKIQTGAGADAILQAKRYAKTLGIDVGDLSGPEAAKAISNQFALELRNPAGGAGMPGALSDKDREFLQASVPGLQQTPEGNAKIIDYMKRVANRAVQVEGLRQQYVRKNGRLNEGFYQALKEYSEANPLFPEGAQRTNQPRRLKFNPQTGELE